MRLVGFLQHGAFSCYPPIGMEIIFYIPRYGKEFISSYILFCQGLFSLLLTFSGLRIEALSLSTVQGECISMPKENLQAVGDDGSTSSPPSLGSPATSVAAAVRRTGVAREATAENNPVPRWGRWSTSLGGINRWGGDPASSTSAALIDLSISSMRFDHR